MHAQLEDLYSLKLPLGRNLAGAVWQAETLKGGKPAAIAVLDLEDLSDPDLRRRTATRFRRDMGLLRQVNHPHVVRVHIVGRTRAGRPFAAMEHVDGENLHNWLDGDHSGADRIRVASGLLDGLQAAHRAGVTHGDLEPGNVLMTRDGTPKLIGFGLNRTLARQSHPEWREESGLAKSIAFRAPEEARGVGGHSADLYATGILLHLICSGELPEGGRSTLRENAPRLPAGLIAVIERALVKDPLERHPNIAAMRRAWLEAAKVARDAIEGATAGFRDDSKRAMRPLSAPPAVGVALAMEEPDLEELEESELDLQESSVARGSLMPVGVALADDDDDDDDDDGDDLTNISPERVNVLSSARPVLETRKISQRFSDPPPDAGMRLSMSDVMEEMDPVDPEMRLSMSDVMVDDLTPTAPPSRRPKPAVVAPDESSGSKMWMGLVVVAAVGSAAFWFTQRPTESDPVETQPAQTRAGNEVERPAISGTDEPEPEPESLVENTAENVEAVIVALRLHGIPTGGTASVDGQSVAIEGDTIPFPSDGAEHTITVRADGYETWERSLATATPLDLLVVSEAVSPRPSMEPAPSMESAPSMEAVRQRNPVETRTVVMQEPTIMQETTEPTPTMTITGGPTMRPDLARDPGF
ncbi:MAG: serine/threonine protein kinase [Polyangiales bacterium]|jgi:serine/threonine protein kinase